MAMYSLSHTKIRSAFVLFILLEKSRLVFYY